MRASPARREPAVAEVVARFAEGSVRALARALSWIEDGDPRGVEVLRAVFAQGGRARVLGVTGPPGAGKSTLVDRLAARLAAAGRRVAVVAVDPSSAFSGGAILGDRVRMDASAEAGVFIRSMATRGTLGGLARTTEDAVDILDAFGFEDVIVETVGVGQDEIEVVQVAHVNLLVLVPSMGDDVQAIKAGIMEIADAYVINKADRDGADRAEAHVRALLQLTEGEPRDVPVLRTVALRGEGIDELERVVDTLFARRTSGGADALRRERVRRRLTLLLRERLLEDFLADQARAQRLGEVVESVQQRWADPHAAVDAVLRGSSPSFDHVGVAVESIEGALAFWRDALGLSVRHVEDVASEGVRVAMLPVGEGSIELLEPLGDGGSVRAFLGRRGPGIHHVCLGVADLRAALERLSSAGVGAIGEAPRPGAAGALVAFIHPRDASGVLLELSQPGRGSEGGP